MTHTDTRVAAARVALGAALTLVWVVLGIAGPVHAQTNSPSGGQSAGQTPSQGGTSSDNGPNAGVGVAIATRHRRVMEDVGAGTGG